MSVNLLFVHVKQPMPRYIQDEDKLPAVFISFADSRLVHHWKRQIPKTPQQCCFCDGIYRVDWAALARLRHRITRHLKSCQLPVVYTNVTTASCRQEKDGGRWTVSRLLLEIRRNLALASWTFVLSETSSWRISSLIIRPIIWRDTWESRDQNRIKLRVGSAPGEIWHQPAGLLKLNTGGASCSSSCWLSHWEPLRIEDKSITICSYFCIKGPFPNISNLIGYFLQGEIASAVDVVAKILFKA